jgi:hypothetical protein
MLRFWLLIIQVNRYQYGSYSASYQVIAVLAHLHDAASYQVIAVLAHLHDAF